MKCEGLRDRSKAEAFYQAIDGEALLLRRDPAFASEGSGSDWDFVPRNPGHAARIMTESLGPPVTSIRRHYVEQHYYEWGQVDFLPALMWRGAVFMEMERLWEHAERDRDGIMRPCLAHDAFLAWMTPLFAGGRFNPRHRGLILQAFENDFDEFESCLREALGKGWAAHLLDLAGQGTPGKAVKRTKELRRALRWNRFKEAPLEVASGIAKHWAREWKLHRNPPMPMIAFLGPDGSGKSSVIRGIDERLHRMRLHSRMQHWRPYGFKGREDLGQPVADPHASKARGKVTSILKLGMLFWDWWLPHLTVLKHARSKNSVVISDRYYHDLLVDPVRYRYGAPLKYARAVFGRMPLPEKTLILVGSPEVIHKRKEEVTFGELVRQLKGYRELGESLGTRAMVIDVDRPLDEVIDDAWQGVVRTIADQGDRKSSRYYLRRRTARTGLKVGQFMPNYPSYEGISAYCRGLSREMNLLEPGSCPIITLRRELKNLSGDEELLHYPHSSWNPLSLPEKLLEDLKNNVHDLDGIVFHGPYHPKAAMLRRHLMKIGMPYIFVPHDPYVEELTQHHAFRKWVFWHLFEKKTIRNAEVVQILAAEHEAPLRQLGFEVPVEEIPNGCELKALSEIPKEVHVPGSKREVRIQYMGRMDRNHKGLDLLIEAFAEFSKEKRFEDVDLVLTGNDWEDRAELEALSRRLGTEDRVIFTGPRPEHSLKIHSEADLVVLPSRFDGFGLTIVEAMLAGRPVLVSRKAGIASHVAKAGGGWLCDPSVEGIRNGLIEACAGKGDWAKMGTMNRKYVSTHLTWKQTAERTLAMYHRYLGGAGAGGKESR